MNKMNNLLTSGETRDCSQWDVDSILTPEPTSSQLKDKLAEYEFDNYIGPYCGDMTYLEIQQFDNTYNNFN